VPTVHPHMRAENATSVPSLTVVSGPPPHAWGKLLTTRQAKATHRSTPTCVGKTTSHEAQLKDFSVHPHIRGENSSGLMEKTNRPGPPPHAWGKPLLPTPNYMPNRSTPTCVGKTCIVVIFNVKVAVHPHMRGEN